MSTKIEKPTQITAHIDVKEEIDNCQIKKTDWIFASTLNLPERDKPLEVHFFRAIGYLWSHNKLNGFVDFFHGLWNWKDLFKACWEEAHVDTTTETIQNPQVHVETKPSLSISPEILNLQKLNLSFEKAQKVWDKISKTELKPKQQYLTVDVEGVKAILYKKKDGSIRRYVWTQDTKLGEGTTKIGMKATELTTGKCRVIFEMTPAIDSSVPPKERESYFRLALEKEEELKPRLKKNKVPHVCAVKKVFTTKNKDRPAFFTYCDSGSLASRIEKGLTKREKETYAIQLFEFLEVLHNKAKIVHRDLKPDNILLHKGEKKEPELMVADFEMWEDISTKTETGTVGSAGTAEYCSIELNSAFNDENATIFPEAYHDLWAAGVTLYEMQTGTLPVSEKTCRELQAASDSDFPRPNPRFTNALAQYRKELETSLNKLKDDPIDKAIKSLLTEDKKRQPTAAKILSDLKSTKGG